MGKPTKRERLASWGCAYCGQSLSLEDLHVDHVVPNCLFTSPRPANLVEVPACYRCNNEKSKFDSFLRDMAVLAKGSMDHPVARELKNTKVKRSIQNNKSEVINHMSTSNDYKYIVDTGHWGGLEFRETIKGSLNIDDDYARNAILWVIRGIYVACFGQIFPIDTDVRIDGISKEYISQAKRIIIQELQNIGVDSDNVKEMNLGDIFKCHIIYSPSKTLFLLCFFDSIAFFVEADCSPLPLVRGQGS